MPTPVPAPRERRYSEAEMLTALEAAATPGRPLTVTAYDEHARAHGGPSGIWLIRHFGTWRAACEKAGVAANPTRGRRATWNPDTVVQRVADYLASPGSRGTYNGYAAWAKTIGTAVPSGPTVRNHFTSWDAVRDLAEEVVRRRLAS